MQRRHFIAGLGAALLVPRLSFAAPRQISSEFAYKGKDDPAAFRDEIVRLSTGSLLCVMFVTGWCGNCKAQDAYFQTLTKGYNKLKVLALDVERFRAISKSFPRQGPVPDNYFFYNSKNIGGFLGAAPSAKELDIYVKKLAAQNKIALAGR